MKTQIHATTADNITIPVPTSCLPKHVGYNVEEDIFDPVATRLHPSLINEVRICLHELNNRHLYTRGHLLMDNGTAQVETDAANRAQYSPATMSVWKSRSELHQCYSD